VRIFWKNGFSGGYFGKIVGAYRIPIVANLMFLIIPKLSLFPVSTLAGFKTLPALGGQIY
jgi:hypothetical protein